MKSRGTIDLKIARYGEEGIADQDGRRTGTHDDAAMDRGIQQPRRRKLIDQNGRGSLTDHIRRSGTGRLIGEA